MSGRCGRFTEWDRVSHWLIRRAARRAPDCLATRLEEEWLADIESRASAPSRLRFAVGCCWAIIVIVNDQPRSPALPTHVVTRRLMPLTERNFGYYSLPSGALFLILGLHGVLFGGLVTTLTHTHGSVASAVAPDHGLFRERSADIDLRGAFVPLTSREIRSAVGASRVPHFDDIKSRMLGSGSQ